MPFSSAPSRPGALADFYLRLERRFAESLEELPEHERLRMDAYKLAPFVSVPEVSLRQNALYVLSMKPYARVGERYTFGWLERETKPTLHRWYDAPRRRGSFVGEATQLLEQLVAHTQVATPPCEVFNTYATFYRAEDAKQLERWGLTAVDCWPYHREFLDVVRPKLILCIGNGAAPSAYAMLSTKLTHLSASSAFEVAPRTYVKHLSAIAPWNDDAQVTIIAVPHLSYTRAKTLWSTVRELLDEYWC